MTTAIIGILVLVAVGLAVRKLVRDKRQHKSSCGCGCSNCPSAGMCHPQKENK